MVASGGTARPGVRLTAVDALRGFTMLWLIGGAEVLLALAAWIENPWLTDVVDNAASHADWEGFHAYDLIFPLFVFVAGVSIPTVIERRRGRGDSDPRQAARIGRRVAVLFALGLVFNGALQLPAFDALRVMGVLQRLALVYGAAALLVLFTSRRTQIVVCISLLVGYWVVLSAVPVSGCARGSLTPECNVANVVDRAVFAPGQLFESYGDPEGLVSTIPAVATALLGVFAGYWLDAVTDVRRRVAGLAVAGFALIATGYAWTPWLPIIKKIWTSSYVLVAAGWSVLLLALFVLLADGRSRRRSLTFLIVIGVNPLVIYLGQEAVDVSGAANFVVGGVAARLPEAVAGVVVASMVLAIKWSVLYTMRRHQIFLRA